MIIESGDLALVIIAVAWFLFSTIKLYIRAKYNYNEEARLEINGDKD